MKVKGYIAIGIAVCVMAGLFAGCGKAADSAESKFLHYPYSEKAAAARKYPISKEQAIRAMAYAYYQKGPLVQYDQTWTSRQNNDFPLRAARWDNTALPELATSQNTKYTDCSKFQNCVYYNTFGYELPAESTEDMLNYPELQVFYYEPTGTETDEEEKAICDTVTNMLQVGDLINYRMLDDSNGHIMLYIGDGMLIHASGSGAGGGDYNYTADAASGAAAKTDTKEPTGTVLQNSVKMLTTYTESRYLLAQLKFGVLRPMKDLTEKDITQDAYCRAAFMQGIVSEITSDYPTGRTVEPGGTIHYTLTMQNLDSVTRSVHVELAAAEHTRLAGDGKGQDLTIASGATETVEFEVTVDENTELGSEIAGPAVKANGMTIAALGHAVNRNLSADVSGRFASVDYTASGATDGFSMVQYAYRQATGSELPFHSATEMMWTLFERDDYNNLALALRENSVARKMLVNTLYGGMRVKNCGDKPGSRAAYITGANLQPGDVLLVNENIAENAITLYLCTASYNLLYWDPAYGGATLLRTGYMAPVMEALLGQEAYAVLRPSFASAEDVPDRSADTVNTASFSGDVIITGSVDWIDAATGQVEVLVLSDGTKRTVQTRQPLKAPTGRLVTMTVAGGYAEFSTPVSRGLYDKVAAGDATTDIRKAFAVDFSNGVLQYRTDKGTAELRIDSGTRIYAAADPKQYGRLNEVEAVQTLTVTAPADEKTVPWNVLFRVNANGSCAWIVFERSGLDISLCVGLPNA